MVRVYRYRLSPSRAQDADLRETLYRLRELYNAALEERIRAYRQLGKTLSAYSQMAELREVREVRPEYAAIHTHLLQDVLTRLDRAFKAFFRRLKAGGKPGFPRFQGRGRYETFTFKDAANHNGVRLLAGAKRVRIHGIGNVKIKLHRPMRGTLKQASVSLSGDGHWYIAFACVDVPTRPLEPTGASVGVDVGISTFAALSTGELVKNPRCHETAERKLGKAQQRVARRKKGSRRRRKAVALLRRQHDKVRRVRLDFHHKVALSLVERFDAISVEKLSIRGLARSRLAKQVLDAAWGQFTTIVASKAECAGRSFSAVDPRGTSQECSGCGAEVRKGLGVRVHRCPHCGLEMDRDVNAGINIDRRGQRLREQQSAGALPVPRSPFLALS